jgi:hypothetical protein
MPLSQEEADSIIETINERATEVRQLIITIGSILALLMPAVEMFGVIDLTPYGEGDDEWIGDDDWEWGDDFTCGDGTRIEASAVDDGYKNCRDGSDEPDDPPPTPPENNTTVVIPPDNNNTTDNSTNNETIEDDCYPMMWDAYYEYNNETDNITIHWDADLSCDDAPHNLTLIWTFYHNDTGNWSGIQEEHTYETYYQDWDYVNITFAVPEGRYDIFSTFRFNDEYTIGTDWFDVELS